MAISLKDVADQIAAKNTITPTTQDFDESKGVAGRTNDLISQDSPLMQTAATQGTQLAAKRGLTNSSLGVQSAQQAVINTAVPIATADASLYQQNSLAGLAAKNAASTANAQIGSTLGSTAMQLGSQEKQQETALGQQKEEFGVTAGQQQQQIDAQKAQFAQQLGLSVQQLDLNRDQLTTQQQQFLQSLDQQKAQLAQQQGQFTASLGANQANFAAELGQKQTQFEASQLQAKVLAQADNDTRLALTKLQTESQQDIQSNQNISGAWGTMMQNIANVQNNPNLDPSAKQTLIQNNIGAFQSFTNFWKKTSGPNMDVTDLLNFGVAGPAAPAPAPVSQIPGYTGGEGGSGE